MNMLQESGHAILHPWCVVHVHNTMDLGGGVSM